MSRRQARRAGWCAAVLAVAALAAAAPSARAAAVIALTNTGQLVRVESTAPGTAVNTVPLSGVAAGEAVFGIDYRPASWQLYGVGTQQHVYTIDAATGIATLVSPSAFTPAPAGNTGDIDFNPTVDRIRLVTTMQSNLRLNPLTGALAATDSALAFVAGDPNDGSLPMPSGLAYTNGATTVTLFAIDPIKRVLLRIGGADGTPSPNSGMVTTVGSLGLASTGSGAAFDIGADATAYAALQAPAAAAQSTLFNVNLTTGAATTAGAFPAGKIVVSLAVAPGTVQLGAATASVVESAGSVTVTITRNPSVTGVVAVNYQTVDGTARAGLDYVAASGSVVFAEGQSTKDIAILIDSDSLTEGDEAFVFRLSGANGIPLGTPAEATITIHDPPPPPVDPGNDAGADAGVEAGTDSGSEAGADIAPEASADSSVEAGTDTNAADTSSGSDMAAMEVAADRGAAVDVPGGTDAADAGNDDAADAGAPQPADALSDFRGDGPNPDFRVDGPSDIRTDKPKVGTDQACGCRTVAGSSGEGAGRALLLMLVLAAITRSRSRRRQRTRSDG